VQGVRSIPDLERKDIFTCSDNITESERRGLGEKTPIFPRRRVKYTPFSINNLIRVRDLPSLLAPHHGE
jgi:hypothetical protein